MLNQSVQAQPECMETPKKRNEATHGTFENCINQYNLLHFIPDPAPTQPEPELDLEETQKLLHSLKIDDLQVGNSYNDMFTHWLRCIK